MHLILKPSDEGNVVLRGKRCEKLCRGGDSYIITSDPSSIVTSVDFCHTSTPALGKFLTNHNLLFYPALAPTRFPEKQRRRSPRFSNYVFLLAQLAASPVIGWTARARVRPGTSPHV